jgi:AraC-like DNA-binding protein
MFAPDHLPLIDAALRGAFIAVVLLLAAGLARNRSGHPATRAGMCLMLGLAVQTVSGLPLLEQLAASLWQAPLVGVSIGNSMLFWLFTRALFDDDFVLRRRHLGLWVAVFMLGLCFYLTVAPPRIDAWFTAPLSVAMRWTPVVFGLLALAATVSQWRADLVERRRRLRVLILLSGSAYTLGMAAVRLTTPHGRLTDLSASLDVAALLTIVASFAVALLRVSTPLLPDDLTGSAPGDGAPPGHGAPATRPATSDVPGAQPSVPSMAASAPTVGFGSALSGIVAGTTASTTSSTGSPAEAVSDPDQDKLAIALARAMSERHAYRQEDLSVASLAAQLGVAEYRLRRLINRRLGHRNFNAYVNGLRLDQACASLADPAQRQQPVLSIALDAGFGSIGPFNRAFKAATGLTPSEYRRQQLDEVAVSGRFLKSASRN